MPEFNSYLVLHRQLGEDVARPYILVGDFKDKARALDFASKLEGDVIIALNLGVRETKR